MKTKLFALLASLLSLTSFAGVEHDLIPGLDPTGRSSVTGAMLYQLVSASYPTTNRGMVIVSSSTPDTANNPRFTNYIWLDISQQPPALKGYGTNGWTSAALSAGSVDSTALASQSVTSDKLATNAVHEWHVNDNTIYDRHIVAGAVVASKIGAQAVTYDKLYPGSVDSTVLTNDAVATANIQDGAVTSAKLAAGVLNFTNFSGTINGSNIITGTVSNAALADLTITGGKIATNTVDTAQITLNAVDRDRIDTTLQNYLPIGAGYASITGGTLTSLTMRGVSAARDNTGIYTITFATARSSTNYIVTATADSSGAGDSIIMTVQSRALGSFVLRAEDDGSDPQDPDGFSFIVLPE